MLSNYPDPSTTTQITQPTVATNPTTTHLPGDLDVFARLAAAQVLLSMRFIQVGL